MFEYYIKQTPPSEKFNEQLATLNEEQSVCDFLSSVFTTYGWTYTIKDVKYGKQNVAVIVTVYLPGIVRDGVGIGANVDIAIDKAIRQMLGTIKPYHAPQQLNIPPKTQSPTVQVQPRSKENCAVPSGNTITSPVHITSQTVPAQDVQLDRQKAIVALSEMFKISMEQAEKFYEVRKKYDIKTKQQLMKYLQSWDSNIQNINELNSSNIDAFIAWAENFTPEGFEVIGGV